jgi:hypothetical protein
LSQHLRPNAPCRTRSGTSELAVRSQQVDDVSVSHNKIGDVQRAHGNLSAALSSYRASLAIIERLTAADPKNAQWQTDLVISHYNLASLDPANRKHHRKRPACPTFFLSC